MSTELNTAKQPVRPLTVTAEESGQKLLQFLTRRTDAPANVLHRWIRTGQVRINGHRAGPFERLQFNDTVRIPPRALVTPGSLLQASSTNGLKDDCPRKVPKSPAAIQTVAGDKPWELPIVLANGHLLVCIKPAGLPTHPGTGHAESLTTILAARYPDTPFRPTPAHRLDKDTSGLLLVARSYTALRLIQNALATHAGLRKTYLAWVRGRCAWDSPLLLSDTLCKRSAANGQERVFAIHGSIPDGREARMLVQCLHRSSSASLLQILLLTGRTHQIRVQLAVRGLPLIGDPKYGGPACQYGLLLHAARLEFAPDLAASLELPQPCITAVPSWPEPWFVAAEMLRPWDIPANAAK